VHLYIVLHLVKSLHVLIALCRLPSLCIAPPASLEGTVIHDSLLQHSVCWRITGLATAVIFVPDEVGEYSLGASKQTLRRKVRHAKRLGIYWTEVNDPCERQLLLEYANELERAHPDAVYRNPSPSNNDLLTYKLWLVAYAADGRPLLLSVTPVDGETGLIRYFRTLGVGEEQSNARYLMTKVLVERLSSLGVRYLIDGTSPFWLTNGLRHFQQIVGFRMVRIRIGRSVPGRGWTWRSSRRAGATLARRLSVLLHASRLS